MWIIFSKTLDKIMIDVPSIEERNNFKQKEENLQWGYLVEPKIDPSHLALSISARSPHEWMDAARLQE